MTDLEKMGAPDPAEGPAVASTASAGPAAVPVAGEARARKKGPYPPEAVRILRAWLLEHGHQRRPSKAEKQMLSEQTGLSSLQICKWFSNTRRRELMRKLKDGEAAKQVAAGHREDGAAPAPQLGHSEPAARPKAQPTGPERQNLLVHSLPMAQEAWGHLLHPGFTPVRRFALRIYVRCTIRVYAVRPLWLAHPNARRAEQRAEFSNLHMLADAAVQRALEQERQQRGARL